MSGGFTKVPVEKPSDRKLEKLHLCAHLRASIQSFLQSDFGKLKCSRDAFYGVLMSEKSNLLKTNQNNIEKSAQISSVAKIQHQFFKTFCRDFRYFEDLAPSTGMIMKLYTVYFGSLRKTVCLLYFTKD